MSDKLKAQWEQLVQWLRNFFVRFPFLRQTWVLLTKSEMGWRVIIDAQPEPTHVKRQFVYPFLVLCMVANFLGFFIANSAGIPFAFIKALFAGISMYSSWWIVCKINPFLVTRIAKKEISEAVNVTVVSYSFSVIFLLNIVFAIFPSLFFLGLLALYTLYVVYVGVGVVLNINENESSKLAIALSALIVLLPWIINTVLWRLLPNAPI